MKIRDFFRSGHIQVSLALGFSIIVLAYVSKRVLDLPMRSIYLSITSRIMAGYEAVANIKKYERYARPVYWVLAILSVTLVIILLHVI